MDFLIELLAEGIPELLFSSNRKAEHEPMPEVELKNDYTVSYSIGQSRVQPCLWFAVSFICFVVPFFTHGDLRIRLYIFAAVFFVASLLSLGIYNTWYDVTSDCIVRTNVCGIRKEWT